MLQLIITLLTFFLFSINALALEPLSEDALYDTSGQATPTVSIQYSDELTIDYFNQNVAIYEPRGEQSASIQSAYYIDTDSNKGLVLYWEEPLTMIFEFDKYQYYPDGIYVTVSDIFKTGADGKPLPQYAEFDPQAFNCIGPNTTYLRTWSSATTTTMLNNKFHILLSDTVERQDPATGKFILTPDIDENIDWEQDPKRGDIILSVFSASKVRTEILGYVYVWSHQ